MLVPLSLLTLSKYLIYTIYHFVYNIQFSLFPHNKKILSKTKFFSVFTIRVEIGSVIHNFCVLLWCSGIYKMGKLCPFYNQKYCGSILHQRKINFYIFWIRKKLLRALFGCHVKLFFFWVFVVKVNFTHAQTRFNIFLLLIYRTQISSFFTLLHIANKAKKNSFSVFFSSEKRM